MTEFEDLIRLQTVNSIQESIKKFISRNNTHFEGYYVVHDTHSSNATLVSTRSSM